MHEYLRALSQTRLHISNAGNQTEESFVMSYCDADGLCTDAAFPPGPNSM